MKERIKVMTIFGTRPEAIKMAKASNPYGDGHASERIVRAILDYFQI